MLMLWKSNVTDCDRINHRQAVGICWHQQDGLLNLYHCQCLYPLFWGFESVPNKYLSGVKDWQEIIILIENVLQWGERYIGNETFSSIFWSAGWNVRPPVTWCGPRPSHRSHVWGADGGMRTFQTAQKVRHLQLGETIEWPAYFTKKWNSLPSFYSTSPVSSNYITSWMGVDRHLWHCLFWFGS